MSTKLPLPSHLSPEKWGGAFEDFTGFRPGVILYGIVGVIQVASNGVNCVQLEITVFIHVVWKIITDVWVNVLAPSSR
jgi:hypothetical protein